MEYAIIAARHNEKAECFPSLSSPTLFVGPISEHMDRQLISMLISGTFLAAVAAAFPTYANEERAWDLLKDEKFRSAFHKVIGARKNEQWVAKLPGPSMPTARQTVGGGEYVFADSCKPHWCNTHNLVIAYSPTSGAVVVKLVEDATTTWFGNPSPEMKAQLEGFYAKRFQP